MLACSETILINLLKTSSWHNGFTPLSNLCAASDLRSYLTDFQ